VTPHVFGCLQLASAAAIADGVCKVLARAPALMALTAVFAAEAWLRGATSAAAFLEQVRVWRAAGPDVLHDGVAAALVAVFSCGSFRGERHGAGINAAAHQRWLDGVWVVACGLADDAEPRVRRVALEALLLHVRTNAALQVEQHPSAVPSAGDEPAEAALPLLPRGRMQQHHAGAAPVGATLGFGFPVQDGARGEWTPEALALLRRLRGDVSPFVAGAAAFVNLPAGVIVEGQEGMAGAAAGVPPPVPRAQAGAGEVPAAAP
jgi:hypothetical protein